MGIKIAFARSEIELLGFVVTPFQFFSLIKVIEVEVAIGHAFDFGGIHIVNRRGYEIITACCGAVASDGQGKSLGRRSEIEREPAAHRPLIRIMLKRQCALALQVEFLLRRMVENAESDGLTTKDIADHCQHDGIFTRWREQCRFAASATFVTTKSPDFKLVIRLCHTVNHNDAFHRHVVLRATDGRPMVARLCQCTSHHEQAEYD